MDSLLTMRDEASARLAELREKSLHAKGSYWRLSPAAWSKLKHSLKDPKYVVVFGVGITHTSSSSGVRNYSALDFPQMWAASSLMHALMVWHEAMEGGVSQSGAREFLSPKEFETYQKFADKSLHGGGLFKSKKSFLNGSQYRGKDLFPTWVNDFAGFKSDGSVSITVPIYEALRLSINGIEDFELVRENTPWSQAIETAAQGPRNMLLFGAPGTGKSHEISRIAAGEGREVVRTVFYGDMTHADFFGGIRPVVTERGVSYDFVPGPFMKAYAKALESSTRKVALVIEELNRVDPSSVFGSLFQLLDRDSSGQSEYSVAAPSETSQWLAKELEGSSESFQELRLPKNLSILATMNSADEGVFPVDAAFRRRFTQKHMDPIAGPDEETFGTLKHPKLGYLWEDLRRQLNEQLTKSGCVEDQLIGPYFAQESDFAEDTAVPEKILAHLWDGPLRFKDRGLIFANSITSPSALYSLNRKASSLEDLFVSSISASLPVFSRQGPPPFLGDLGDTLNVSTFEYQGLNDDAPRHEEED